MRELEVPIGQVWRRLRFQRFLAAFVWSLGGCLTIATIVLIVERLGRPIPGPEWIPFAIAGGLALLIATAVAAFSGPNRVDAAVAIDRAFRLNERLSTTLTLPADLKETPAGRALLADTIKQLRDLDISSEFGPKPPKLAWIPLLPMLVAALALLVPELTQRSLSAKMNKEAEKFDRKIVAKQTEALGKKISAQRKEMDKAQFAEAEKLLAEIEKAANDLAKAPPAEKDKALISLNKLTDALKDRQKQIGSPEQIGRQLQQLKDVANNGPGEDFAKALAKGDFQKAADEVKKLQEKLLAGKMSDSEKQALKEQLGEMSKQLQKLANLDQRKKQLEEARKNGGLSEEQFQKEMAKLNEQSKNLEALQKLAQQLAQAQTQMNKGDLQKAAEQLGMSKQELQDMAKQVQELQALENAMAELQDAKNGMNEGDGFNQFGENLAGGMDQRKGMGNGLGRGRGQGDRPEAQDNTSAYNTKVKQQFGKGKAVIEGTAPPSTQMKGESTIIVQGEIEAASGLAADALTNQKIPKNLEKHIRGYFDRINNKDK